MWARVVGHHAGSPPHLCYPARCVGWCCQICPEDFFSALQLKELPITLEKFVFDKFNAWHHSQLGLEPPVRTPLPPLDKMPSKVERQAMFASFLQEAERTRAAREASAEQRNAAEAEASAEDKGIFKTLNWKFSRWLPRASDPCCPLCPEHLYPYQDVDGKCKD